ncbi:PAS domain-containing protein, partial [Salmonella enterica]|uniref:PAS domain-containing protein n=1 Tax=Salmonella enterica TaxID=28901 RepID=UPI00329729A1
EAALEGEEAVWEREALDGRGGRLVQQGTFVPDLDEAGRCRGFYVLVNDITELRVGEEARAENASRLRELADAM